MLRTFFFLSSVPPLQVSRKRTKCFFLVLVYGRPYMLGNVVVVVPNAHEEEEEELGEPVCSRWAIRWPSLNCGESKSY